MFRIPLLAAAAPVGGVLIEAENVCAAAAQFISGTDSRVCRLWLEPLYLDVLLAQAKEADSEMKPGIAVAKRQLALAQLESYRQLVAECESPRFTREAERLAEILGPDRSEKTPGKAE